MGFFSKLKSELKFKKSGKGQTTGNNSSNTSQSIKSLPKTEKTLYAQNQARQAALNRFEKQQSQTQPKNKTADAVKRRARAELAMEREEEKLADYTKYSIPDTDSTTHLNTQLATQGVYFNCPLTEQLLQRHQFDEHLMSLFDQFLAEINTHATEDEDKQILLNLLFTLNDCNAEKWRVGTSTLNTYLGNVIKDPNNEKFRKIRRGNAAFQNRVASMVGMEKFLAVIGFQLITVDSVEFYMYPHDDALVKFPGWISLMANEPTPIIFTLARSERLFVPRRKGHNNSQMDLPVDFYNLSKAELRKVYDENQLKLELDKMVLTSEMRERLNNKYSKKFKYCLIRIVFPDELVLQGTFRPQDQGSKLKEFVRTWLALPDIPFQLKARGEPDVLKDNCLLEKYTPSAVFNLIIDHSLLQDIREQTGQLHLVNKDILARLEEF